MELEFRDSFLKDIQHINEKTLKKKVAALIADAKSAQSLSDLRNVKKLEGSDAYYRIRVGNYRIGAKIQNETLILIRLLHRKDIYRYFP